MDGREKGIVGVRSPYLRVVGIHVNSEEAGHSTGVTISPEEEDLFRRLAASPNIYERLAKSVAPSIFGFADIKKAITCLLFGGIFHLNFFLIHLLLISLCQF